MGWVAIVVVMAAAGDLFAFGVYPSSSGLFAPDRWDAAPRTIDGLERSLDGGLRYSLQGGSYEAYRDLFTWDQTPSVEVFQTAIESAFGAWMATDPVSGLATDLWFTPDFGTAVDQTIVGQVRYGAEIDLFGLTDAIHWNPGDSKLQAEAYHGAVADHGNMTLTSGTTGYWGSAIAGADVTINANVGAVWNLATFQTILTHELGHALGLDDVDTWSGPLGYYIDDNYDPTDSATAAATLTNPFADLIDPYDPFNSPLSFYTVADGDPGFDTPGVDILMESRIAATVIGFGNPLANDDYAGRQFLYPFVIPEPAVLAVMAGFVVAAAARRRRS